ncbi:MAG: DUF1512 domain-containing protein [Fervidicoccaceae archaeon]
MTFGAELGVPSTSTVTDWVTAVSQLVFTLVFLMLLFGFNQRIQVYMWSRSIRSKLAVLEDLARDGKSKVIDFLKSLGADRAEELTNKFIDYFVIEPVDIEPIDIIKRLDHILRVRELRLEEVIREHLRGINESLRSLAYSSLEIVLALHFIFKYVRHLLLTGQKTNNWVLIMQLEMLMPTILRQAQTYRRALDVFMEGKPIGDGIGPLVAFNLVRFAERKELVKDTVFSEVELEGRKLYVVKAKGPDSNVGHPGEAVEKLVNMLIQQNQSIGMIITIDAALKLEGEETGSIAEGVGAAIGDPGPEKIRIERVAAAHNIPLHAIVIKMSMEEAVLEISKEIAQAAQSVTERVRELVRRCQPGSSVIIVGIGNTMGIV